MNSAPATYRDPFTADDPRANRKGRSKGSRAKLAQRFFEDTYAAWEEQGPSVLARAAFHDPVAFANMVARLMPQKIEVSTPTDGMSDERLAEMLDLAERMARLRAGEGAKVIEGSAVTVADPLRLNGSRMAGDANHENGDLRYVSTEGGGGPDRVEPHGGVNTSSPLRPESADNPVAEYNKLDAPDSDPVTENSLNATVAEAPLPHPVGRAQPLGDAEAKRRNLAKLNDDIDPASLF